MCTPEKKLEKTESFLFFFIYLIILSRELLAKAWRPDVHLYKNFTSLWHHSHFKSAPNVKIRSYVTDWGEANIGKCLQLLNNCNINVVQSFIVLSFELFGVKLLP